MPLYALLCTRNIAILIFFVIILKRRVEKIFAREENKTISFPLFPKKYKSRIKILNFQGGEGTDLAPNRRVDRLSELFEGLGEQQQSNPVCELPPCEVEANWSQKIFYMMWKCGSGKETNESIL